LESAVGSVGRSLIAKPRAGAKLRAMSFAQVLDNLALRKSPLLRRFEALIAPKSDTELEALAQEAHARMTKLYAEKEKPSHRRQHVVRREFSK
jgi:hypothetical protein